MKFKELLESIKLRPGMYGDDMHQLRSFLIGYYLGAQLGVAEDPEFARFHGEFGDFVDAKYANSSTAMNWAHLISEQPGCDEFTPQARLFITLVQAFSEGHDPAAGDGIPT